MGADEVGGEMYPAVMVLLTSALGMAVAQRLKSQASLGPLTAWLLLCMYASKLAMLLLPQVCASWLLLRISLVIADVADTQCKPRQPVLQNLVPKALLRPFAGKTAATHLFPGPGSQRAIAPTPEATAAGRAAPQGPAPLAGSRTCRCNRVGHLACALCNLRGAAHVFRGAACRGDAGGGPADGDGWRVHASADSALPAMEGGPAVAGPRGCGRGPAHGPAAAATAAGMFILYPWHWSSIHNRCVQLCHGNVPPMS